MAKLPIYNRRGSPVMNRREASRTEPYQPFFNPNKPALARRYDAKTLAMKRAMGRSEVREELKAARKHENFLVSQTKKLEGRLRKSGHTKIGPGIYTKTGMVSMSRKAGGGGDDVEVAAHERNGHPVAGYTRSRPNR